MERKYRLQELNPGTKRYGSLAGFDCWKGKVFYGQEPPSGESTTIECGFNYQLLAVIY